MKDTGEEKQRNQLRQQLVNRIGSMGYPPELGYLLGEQLATPNALRRMLGYLNSAHPRSAEEITDEMLAICDDRDRWMAKKKAEYYNGKVNATTCRQMTGILFKQSAALPGRGQGGAAFCCPAKIGVFPPFPEPGFLLQ